MCPELILWDWNGTLLDDVDLCVDALNRLLAGFGYPQRYDHERYRAIFGFPIEEYYVRAGFDFTKHSFAELADRMTCRSPAALNASSASMAPSASGQAALAGT